MYGEKKNLDLVVFKLQRQLKVSNPIFFHISKLKSSCRVNFTAKVDKSASFGSSGTLSALTGFGCDISILITALIPVRTPEWRHFYWNKYPSYSFKSGNRASPTVRQGSLVGVHCSGSQLSRGQRRTSSGYKSRVGEKSLFGKRVLSIFFFTLTMVENKSIVFGSVPFGRSR